MLRKFIFGALNGLCFPKAIHVSFSFVSLVSIQHLSVDNNQLTELPIEFCALTTLEEFHAAGNKLTSLPLEIGYLISLEKLYLQRNKIRELPEVRGTQASQRWYLEKIALRMIVRLSHSRLMVQLES